MKKEFKHLFRDVRMFSILLFFPIFLLIVFGYAVNFDVENIQLALLDKSKSQHSIDFTNTLTNSNYFKLVKVLDSDKEIKETLDKKYAQCILIIPKNFEEDFSRGNKAQVQLITDGVDGNTATIIQNYVAGAATDFNLQYISKTSKQKGLTQTFPIEFKPLFWFNPDLQTTKFLIPGLIAMILVITAIISVSLSLVREKEKGTIEQIDVSPIKNIELILGKTIPYMLLALFNAVFILIMGYILFNVEVKGNYLLLAISTIIFLFTSTSIGIFISIISDSQQIAFTIGTFVSLLPSVILSGFIFPIESMPYFIQLLTNITPAKFFIKILRAIILRGVGLSAFWDQIIYLLVFAFIFIVLSNIIYTKKAKQT